MDNAQHGPVETMTEEAAETLRHYANGQVVFAVFHDRARVRPALQVYISKEEARAHARKIDGIIRACYKHGALLRRCAWEV